MKSIVLSSVVTALLVFSGCSSNKPAVDTSSATETLPAQEVATVATETVSSEDSMVGSSANEIASQSTMSMADVEAELSSIHFAFDKYNLNAKTEAKVSKVAEIAKSDAANFNLKLEGNCDEWGSDEYNFALGLRRADTVKKALIAEGIDASRISMVSYGESNPVCTAQTQECYAKNRRVDFKLLP